MNQIADTNLFIGDQWAAVSQQLKENNIKYILNVTPVFVPKQDGIIYKQIKWDDNPEQNITNDFDEIFEFIENANGENVLIHCQAGRSRSGSALIYYIMRKKKMSYEDTLRYVRKYRNRIEPNIGFILQLKK